MILKNSIIDEVILSFVQICKQNKDNSQIELVKSCFISSLKQQSEHVIIQVLQVVAKCHSTSSGF